MFTPGFWSHEKFKDIFIEVLDAVKHEDISVLKIRYWNHGQTGTPFLIRPDIDEIKVYCQQYHYWHQINPNISSIP